MSNESESPFVIGSIIPLFTEYNQCVGSGRVIATFLFEKLNYVAWVVFVGTGAPHFRAARQQPVDWCCMDAPGRHHLSQPFISHRRDVREQRVAPGHHQRVWGFPAGTATRFLCRPGVQFYGVRNHRQWTIRHLLDFWQFIALPCRFGGKSNDRGCRVFAPHRHRCVVPDKTAEQPGGKPIYGHASFRCRVGCRRTQEAQGGAIASSSGAGQRAPGTTPLLHGASIHHEYWTSCVPGVSDDP